MSADYSIEIYESEWTRTPSAAHLLSTIEVPEGQAPPSVGDVISIAKKGETAIDVKVTARTHLATEGPKKDGHVWWKKTWIFVTRV